MKRGETDEAFTRLFNEHSLALRRFTLRRFSDSRVCEDIVAETFLIAWRRWGELPPKERELQWLYGIAFRVLSNQRRSRDRRDRLFTRLSFERNPDPEDLETGPIDFLSIRVALSQLRDSDRELLEFVYWEKLTYREISEIVGVSENAVGIRINRAKSQLKKLLSPHSLNESSPALLREEVED
jgi:RNA polymerase sigma-70 factor (ECF subfamily)